MDLIREAMGLDENDSRTQDLVWKVEGYRSFLTADSFNLEGILWTKPILAQDELCILSRYSIYGEDGGSGYEWSDEPYVSYENWLVDDERGCELQDPSQLEFSITTSELQNFEIVSASGG